jgi:hypothetical protein
MSERVNKLIDKGRWVEPSGSEDDPSEIEYRRQMTAEYKKRKVDKFSGKVEWKWVCPSHNNHAFDCAKMQVVAAILADLVPDSFGDD